MLIHGLLTGTSGDPSIVTGRGVIGLLSSVENSVRCTVTAARWMVRERKVHVVTSHMRDPGHILQYFCHHHGSEYGSRRAWPQ